MRTGRIIAVLLVLSSVALGGDSRYEGYELPVLPGYIVRHTSNADTYDRLSRDSLGGLTLVEQLKTVGHQRGTIYGRRFGGFYLLDTQAADAEPSLFDREKDWLDALRAAGVTLPPDDADPDVLASKLPERTLRPWLFVFAGGALGLTDDQWSGVTQLIALSFAFAFGFGFGSRKSMLSMSIVLGVITTVVSQLWLGGGGPGVMLGPLIFPIFFLIVAKVGQSIAWLFRRERKPAPAL